jgi:hypothetical protein
LGPSESIVSAESPSAVRKPGLRRRGLGLGLAVAATLIVASDLVGADPASLPEMASARPWVLAWFVLVACLAVAPWCLLLAKRAARAPISTAAGLSALTFVSTIPAIVVANWLIKLVMTAVGLVAMFVSLTPAPTAYSPQPWTPADETPVDLSDAIRFLLLWPLPWIIIGAATWTVLMRRVARPRTTPRSMPSAAGVARVGIGVVAAIALIVAMAPVSGPPQPNGTPYVVPAKPAAHRPTVAGMVASVHWPTITLTSGRAIDMDPLRALGREYCEKDDFLFVREGEGSFFDCWSVEPEHYGGDRIRSSDAQFAWDEGAYVLFADGLELPKAIDFDAYLAPAPWGPDKVYPPHQGAAYFVLTGTGEVQAWRIYSSE